MVPIALDNRFAPGDTDVNSPGGVWTFADQISETDDPGDIAAIDIGQDRLKGGHVAVDVGDQGNAVQRAGNPFGCVLEGGRALDPRWLAEAVAQVLKPGWLATCAGRAIRDVHIPTPPPFGRGRLRAVPVSINDREKEHHHTRDRQDGRQERGGIADKERQESENRKAEDPAERTEARR